jgi:hypothetical protein
MPSKASIKQSDLDRRVRLRNLEHVRISLGTAILRGAEWSDYCVEIPSSLTWDEPQPDFIDIQISDFERVNVWRVADAWRIVMEKEYEVTV